jgi:hypothetical protein
MNQPPRSPFMIALWALIAVAAPASHRSVRGEAKTEIATAFAAAYGKSGGKVKNEVGTFQYGRPVMIPIDRDHVALITSATMEDAAYSDSGRLAVHYLRRTSKGFIVDQAWLNVEGGTSIGAAPGFSISRKFGSNPTIITTGGGTWQGYTCSRATIIELTKTGPIMRGDVPLSYSNAGAVANVRDAIQLDGTFVHVVKGRGFEMAYNGYLRFAESYVLSGGKYVLAKGGASKMETC